ncbi:hypothetical protein UFOVP1454_13 [uncultured Caudovirales phage]|uniref:Uncharacterized protein n=1 Tax=uncultured Caudovirales phage TaxID=2100421 RepID=A0A6J5SI06_9CAUD|nr:hypothetical protein UFOVP1454_13 [uncultured Caudovirales phage]
MREREQQEEEPFWTKELIQPLGMMCASSLNVIGGAILLMVSEKDRSNPFIYTAMTTSLIYVVSNAIKSYQVHQEQVQSFQEREKAKRELSAVVIEK